VKLKNKVLPGCALDEFLLTVFLLGDCGPSGTKMDTPSCSVDQILMKIVENLSLFGRFLEKTVKI
jgi:hypothetical protein